MENINGLINKSTRMVVLSKTMLGNDGENLQENLVFSFVDEFVNGTARLELTMPDDTNSYIMLNKVGETYQLPVKSVMTQEGKISMQLVITEGTSEEDIPIFKSNVFSLKVRKSINAETISEDEYPDFIDKAETKLNAMDEALEDVNSAIDEVENLDLDVSKSGKVATVTLTKKDATTKSVTLSDGTSLMFNWDGTRLGIKTDEDSEYTYVDLQGVQGPIGPKGEAFTIKKTYTSLAEMNADFNNMELGDYVMIASTVEVEDNAKLYTRGESQWIFISDFSGAQGIRGETGLTPNIQIGTVVTGQTSSVTRTGTNENPILNFVLEKGETGATGQTGATGETGNGIVSIGKTGTVGLVDTYTITYSDGTTSTFEVTNGEDGEVTQAQFDKLQHRVEDLETNQLMNTVTGTEINVDDAHETEVVEDRMSKLSTQQTTTGKNLFNYIDNLQSSVSGLTSVINDDGSITTSGVLTTNYSRVVKLINLNSILENGQTYTYSQSEQNGYLFMQLTRTNKSTGTSTYIGLNTMQSYTFVADLLNYDYSMCVQTITTSTWGSSSRTITLSYQLEKNNSATTFEPYTFGASPNPDYPQEIKVVTGYKNLLDTIKSSVTVNGVTFNPNADGSIRITGTSSASFTYPIVNNLNPPVLSAGTYTRSVKTVGTIVKNGKYVLLSGRNNLNEDKMGDLDIISNYTTKKTSTLADRNTMSNIGLYCGGVGVVFDCTLYIQLVEGTTEELPYVPYGNNYVYMSVSNGNDTNYFTIPLNGNEIAGIGDYKDELIIDSNGHCWLNKKIEKIVLDGDTKKFISKSPYFTSDTKGFYQFSLPNKYIGNDGDTNNGKSNYFRFRTGSANAAFRNYANGLWWEGNTLNCYAILELTTLADANAWLLEHNTTIYYKLKESAFTLIDLNYDIDIRLFNGINNITNSDDMDMTIKYVQDINAIINELRNE